MSATLNEEIEPSISQVPAVFKDSVRKATPSPRTVVSILAYINGCEFLDPSSPVDESAHLAAAVSEDEP